MGFNNRREFLRVSAFFATGAGLSTLGAGRVWAAAKNPAFKISLAEYSLHRMIGKKELAHADVAPFAKKEFDIDAVDLWNRPFMDKAKNAVYLAECKQKSDDAGVKSLLIMIDGEGNLGEPDEKGRTEAIEKHYKWVEAAKTLGCHSIRVDAHSKGTPEDQMKLVVDGLGRLSTFAKDFDINVIVENHGGLSSDGGWLSGVMKAVDMKNCGTLPDFGNFGSYDRYKGVAETMPFAKSVSAKSHEFNASGEETRTDYHKMMKIVYDAGYRGYVGIEYEGSKHSEIEGVKLTKKLLEKCLAELSA